VTITGEGEDAQQRALSLKNHKTITAEVKINGKYHLAGKLKIWHNAPEYQKTAQVTLVMVSTQTINEKKLNDAKRDAIQYFKKYLPQALVQVEIDVDFLDLSTDTDFLTKYMKDGFIIKGSYKNEKESKEFVIELKNKYKKESIHYLAFYFYQNEGGSITKTEKGEEKIETIAGYSSSEGAIILFSISDNYTCTHELCHAIGLDHSFSNAEANNNKFTFKVSKTDNIMDYSSASDANKRFSFWKWQWGTLQSKISNSKKTN